MKVINVAVGIILDSSKSKVLVAQRNTKDEHFGQWEFPGGKIDSGESAQDALKRELYEELGIEINSFQLFDHFNYKYSQKNVSLHFYIVTDFFGKARGKEGQLTKWQDIKHLQELKMLEANREIIEKLNTI